MPKLSNKSFLLAVAVFATCFLSFFFDPLLIINRDRFDYFSEEIVECSMLHAASPGWPDRIGLGVYLPKESCRSQFTDGSITQVARTDLADLTDANWERGLSRYSPSFIVPTSFWNVRRYMPGERLEFPDGSVRAVLETSISNSYVTVRLNGPVEKSFSNTFVADGSFPSGDFIRYESQIGGPGFIFGELHRIFRKHDVNFYRGFNIALFSLCMAFVGYFIAFEFGLIAASSLCIAAIFSPWLVNVSGNLYWMAWTWFLPTVLVLWLSSRSGYETLSDRFGRSACAAYFAVVALKCACGYEYLPSILIMSFLPVVYFWARDRHSATDAIRSVCKIGIAGCAAFGAVLLTHAYLRAGSISAGIRAIASDVTRRTYASGGEAQEMLGNGASVVEVIGLYFGRLFQPIVAGITEPFYVTLGVLAVFAILLMAWKGKHRALGIVFFVSILAPMSWLIAAKGHSFVHPHINAVLWDMPTVLLGVICAIVALSNCATLIRRQMIARVDKRRAQAH
jgi:hypothetical protein